MIQMMLATLGSSSATRSAQQKKALMRRTAGFAIFASGLAVIVAQALQHAFGG